MSFFTSRKIEKRYQTISILILSKHLGVPDKKQEVASLDIIWAQQRVTEPPLIGDANFKDYLLQVFGDLQMPSNWQEALQLYMYLLRVTQ